MRSLIKRLIEWTLGIQLKSHLIYFNFAVVLTAFQQHIESKLPFLKDRKLLIAISGGVDSVVLTHLVYKSSFEIELAHCNFRLRGKDSDKDEQFVRELATELGVKIHVRHFDTESYAHENKLSTQMAARNLRYKWFEELLEQNELEYLLTAHHLDDSLETFLINFTRGTGLEGLMGIPTITDKTVRPLLVFSRAEIQEYANENNLQWRDDVSNAETKYTRNKVRHHIIPLLKELNPSLLGSFQQTTRHLLQSQQIIEDRILELKKQIVIPVEAGTYKMDVQKIKKLSDPKAYLYEILKTYGFTEWNDVTNLLDAQSGKQIMSTTHRLIKDRESLLLYPLPSILDTTNYLIDQGQKELKTRQFILRIKELESMSRERHAELVQTTKNNEILVDGERLVFPLRIRQWQNGDYFYPFGMRGKKKLSKFFKDEKYSLIDKETTWILCSGHEIVWVIGKRMDDRFKVTENTKKIIQLKYCEA